MQVEICDDYCVDKTREEIQAVLAGIAGLAYPVLCSTNDEEKPEDNRPDGGKGGQA